MKTLYRTVIITAAVWIVAGMFVPTGRYRLAPIVASVPAAQATTPAKPNYVIMDVSAYCLCAKCCGIWAEKGKVNGIRVAASGVPAVGRICAAPRRYPFGTVFEVQGVASYVCEDRGGAITEDKLDLLFEDHQAALNFGRHDLKVRIYYAK